jgi:hypothetical protein
MIGKDEQSFYIQYMSQEVPRYFSLSFILWSLPVMFWGQDTQERSTQSSLQYLVEASSQLQTLAALWLRNIPHAIHYIEAG